MVGWLSRKQFSPSCTLPLAYFLDFLSSSLLPVLCSGEWFDDVFLFGMVQYVVVLIKNCSCLISMVETRHALLSLFNRKLSPFSTAYISVFKLTLRPFQHILYIFIYTPITYVHLLHTYLHIFKFTYTHIYTFIYIYKYIYIYIYYIYCI